MTHLGAANSLMSLENTEQAVGGQKDKDKEAAMPAGKSADKSHDSSPNKVLLLSSKKDLDPSAASHAEASAGAQIEADN